MATLLTLTSFEKSGLQLKVVRDSIFRRKKVSSMDRQRATALTNEIIRWMSVLDSMYTPFLKYQLKRLNPKVKAALRMGVYEGVIDSEVPPYAAIDSAVETIKVASMRITMAMNSEKNNNNPPTFAPQPPTLTTNKTIPVTPSTVQKRREDSATSRNTEPQTLDRPVVKELSKCIFV